MKRLTVRSLVVALLVVLSLPLLAQNATPPSASGRSTLFPEMDFPTTKPAPTRVYKVLFAHPVKMNPNGGFRDSVVLCVRNPVMVGPDWFESDFISAEIETTCTTESFPSYRHGFLRMSELAEVFSNATQPSGPVDPVIK